MGQGVGGGCSTWAGQGAHDVMSKWAHVPRPASPSLWANSLIDSRVAPATISEGFGIINPKFVGFVTA